MQQLFLDVDVDTVHFTSKRFKSADMKNLSNEQMLDSLNVDMFGVYTPNGYSSSSDYFYITNLEIPSSKPDTYLGGFHCVGDQGGVQVKYISSGVGETPEEQTTHELGHWIGFPHTWKRNGFVRVIVDPNEGGTKDNFMDYKIRRKKWLKIQLLNHRR